MAIDLLQITLHKLRKLRYVLKRLHTNTLKPTISNYIVFFLLSIAIVILLLGSVQNHVFGQSQPPLSVEQFVALEEAEQLNKKAIDLYNKGRFIEAIPFAKRSLVITEKVLGKEHLYVAATLNNLAMLYLEQGNYQQAEPLYQRSLKIKEKILGKEHVDIATALNNLGGLYQAEGSYQQAKTLFLRAQEIREKALGDSHPLVANSLNNLATLYVEQGNYQQAEPLFQRALSIREKAPGVENSSLATSLNNLAGLYLAQGNYQQAELMYQRSLKIYQNALGNSHPLVAVSLNNLGLLYKSQRNYKQAEYLFQQALQIRKNVLQDSHPAIANSFNNLALLYKEQNNYQQAQILYKKSLSIVEKELGKEHPNVGTSLNNLAALYVAERKYQQAEPLFQRSLAIFEKTLGNLHPNVANNLINLASLYQAKDDIARATDYYRRGLDIQEKNLNLIFAVGSEQRKQNYAKTFTATTNVAVSFYLQQRSDNADAMRLGLTTILRRKGRVLDAMSDNVQILRNQLENKPEAKKLFDEWFSILQQQSALVSREQGKQTPEQYKTRFEKLETEKQRLEAAISNISAEFRTETFPVELVTIQAKIPKDAALVEIVQYDPYNAKAKKQDEKWGKSHYAAAVLHYKGVPKLIDLGEVSAIDESVFNLRKALEARRQLQPGDDKEQINIEQVQQLARALDKQVMAPIRPLLGKASHILLSPDGQLSLIPFETLRDEQGKYLIQRYAFSYLTTGRDLLRFESTVSSSSSPLVLADINYDNADVAIATPDNIRGEERHSSDLSNTPCCNPLPNTKQEALAIKTFMPNAKVLLDSAATKAALKQVQAPSVLHIATHGFFFPDQEKYLRAPSNELDVNSQQKVLRLENPLLRSGLALAGFNNRNNRNPAPDPSNDGVLTALEVAGLNLRGTKLVVLSACETGLGDVKVGDGIYGLRRALIIAGSQSQLFTLWLVSDTASKELMMKYYQNLKDGKGRHEALRQAQLEMLKTSYYQHPYFWASFIPSGNWTPLSS